MHGPLPPSGQQPALLAYIGLWSSNALMLMAATLLPVGHMTTSHALPSGCALYDRWFFHSCINGFALDACLCVLISRAPADGCTLCAIGSLPFTTPSMWLPLGARAELWRS